SSTSAGAASSTSVPCWPAPRRWSGTAPSAHSRPSRSTSARSKSRKRLRNSRARATLSASRAGAIPYRPCTPQERRSGLPMSRLRAALSSNGWKAGACRGWKFSRCNEWIGKKKEEPAMNLAELNKIAEAMVAPGRGILAADESSGTIKKRFESIGVESTPDTRRDYRELLFRSTDAMSKCISGVILYDETIRQNARDGTPLVKVIEKAGALPGIKVDKGTKPLPFSPGEVITEGLDGLRERLAEYRGLGAKFAKWRAVIDIGDGIPSWNCIKANTHALARYAALCQEEQIVPIVEPEVLMDGAHDIDRCYAVTEWVLKTLYNELYEARVPLEGT